MNIAQFAVYNNKTVSVYFLQKSSNGHTKNAITSKYNDKQEEMKESKAVYVTKDKIRDDQNLVYQLYRSERDERSQSAQRYEKRFNFGCQYDSKRDNEICTCKNVITLKKQEPRYFSGSPKQIYAYQRSRSFTEIGVGSVKALQKRKVKRVYLPETDDRGVGSSDLSSFITRKKYPQLIAKGSYYDHKRTSSKCIGGFMECNTGRVISEKLSPITHTKSGATSPKISCLCMNTEIGSNTIDKELETTGTQFDARSESGRIASCSKTSKYKTTAMDARSTKKLSQHTQKFKFSKECLEKKAELEKKAKECEKVFSSDSLVQHVHNLEVPCNEKRSRNSFPDPMENQLEREYRKMFSNTKFSEKTSFNKPISECKSPSVLKRRFEALRRGVKKDDSISKNNDSATIEVSTKESPSRRDASVTSDPPSLISRSFSNTKIDSPIPQKEQDQIGKQTSRYKREKHSVQWPQDPTDSEQGVKGMFKMWGKKFNFEDDTDVKQITPKPSIESEKKFEKEVKPKTETSPKKESRKFFFFKKKSKDKNKEAYSQKKNVTAGRCEIKDGLTLKLGETTSTKSKISKISEEEDDITRKAWLRRFLSKTAESARSVNVRWNNSMYATSSSTVFDLLETIYKNTGVVFKSRSEISTEASSYYRSITQHRVNFVQDIEAWMVPKTILDRPTNQLPQMRKSNRQIEQKSMDVSISDQKWFIEKSEAFSNKIEVVLRSGNYDGPTNKQHSEYLRIDIPKHFFDSATSEESKRNPSSDEEVYKIVEYETNSEIGAVISNFKRRSTNDIEVIVNVRDSRTESNVLKTVIKRPTTQRDVVIQGSKVNIPQRCDVIGVGIITQRDLREMKKPVLRVENNTSDEESDFPPPNNNKCVLAESYLQDSCRHWTPLGMDLYSWCVSDRHLRSCSEKSVSSYFYQAEGTKSCPNIFEDFQATTMVKDATPCDKLSASSKCNCEDKPMPPDKCCKKFLKIFKKNNNNNDTKAKQEKRVLPKDSLEVFKRRKIYALSAKSQWGECHEKPASCTDCTGEKKKKKSGKKDCKKRVVVPDGILQYRGAGCDKSDVCKTITCKSSKHAVVNPQPSKEIPEPFCKTMCEEMKKPPCEKSDTPCKADDPGSPNLSKASKESCACCKDNKKKPNAPPPCVKKKSDIPPCSRCCSTASSKGKSAVSCSSNKSQKQSLCEICGAPPQEGCPHSTKSSKKLKKSTQSKEKMCDICGAPAQEGCPHCSKAPKNSGSKQKICDLCGSSPQVGCPHCQKPPQKKSNEKLCDICGASPQGGCPHGQKSPQNKSNEKLCDICGAPPQEGCPHCQKPPQKKSNEKLCDICGAPPQAGCPHCQQTPKGSLKLSQSKHKCDLCGSSPKDGSPPCQNPPNDSGSKHQCDLCGPPPNDGCSHCQKPSTKSAKPSQSKQKMCDICGAPSQEGCPHCQQTPKGSLKLSQSKHKCDLCGSLTKDGSPPCQKPPNDSGSKHTCDLCGPPSNDGCPHCQKPPTKPAKPSQSKQKMCDICGAPPQEGCPHCQQTPKGSLKLSQSKHKCDLCGSSSKDGSPPCQKPPDDSGSKHKCDLCGPPPKNLCPHCQKPPNDSGSKHKCDLCGPQPKDGCPHCQKPPAKSAKTSQSKQKMSDMCGAPPQDGCPQCSKPPNKSVKPSQSKQKVCVTSAPPQDGCPHCSKPPNKSAKPSLCDICGATPLAGCPHCSKPSKKSNLKPSQSKQKMCDLCGLPPQDGCPHCQKSSNKSAKPSQSKQKMCDICGAPPQEGCPHCSKSSKKSAKPSQSKQKLCDACAAPPKDVCPHCQKPSDGSDSHKNCRAFIGPHHRTNTSSSTNTTTNTSTSQSSESCCVDSGSEDQMKPYEPPPCLSNLSGCCYSPSSCRLANSEVNVASCCSSPSKAPFQKSKETQNESPCETCQQTNTGSGVGISLKIYPAPPKPPPPPPPPPPPKVSTCNVPPCNQIKKQTSKEAKTCKPVKTEDEDFPWPLNNQDSKCCTPEPSSPKCCAPPPRPTQCCPPSPKSSTPKPRSPQCCQSEPPSPSPPKSCSSAKSESSLNKCKKACTMKKTDQKAPKKQQECPGKKSSANTVNENCPAEPCRAGGPICSSKESKPKVPECCRQQSPTVMVNENCPTEPCKAGVSICGSKESKAKVSDSAKKPVSKKKNEKCPTEPCQANGPICSSQDSKPKMSGIHLNKKPSERKTCADDCSAWDTVKGKQESPSTCEIREPKNFKLKDEDGKTICERRDYGAEKHRPSVLGDVYRDSNVRRVSTPTSDKNVSKKNDKDLASKSDQSLSNLIEIQFKLRVTQGDKTTGVNVVNDNEKNKKTTNENWEASPSVYVVKDGAEEITEETNSNKNDINIKIIFRNFKPRNKVVESKTNNDEFSKNISKKLHTVSTGYSEIMTDVNEDQVYSVHRTTVNLSSSAEKSKAQSNSSEALSRVITDMETNCTVSQSTEHISFQTNLTEDENVEGKSMSTRKTSHSEKLDEPNTYESEPLEINDTDDPDNGLLDIHTSNEYNCDSANAKETSKQDKKLLLKKVFSRVGRTHKTKKSVRQLRDMLKIILTDSSEVDDVNAASNELLKDVTYESLKPNYFRDTDSMNNYYQLDSNISSMKATKNEVIYPSIENSSEASRGSDMETIQECRGCMCSKIAEKLNKTKTQNIRCCCRPNTKKDEEISCNLNNDEASYLFNYRAVQYADVETQNSKYISSKVNSLNVSIHSKSITEDSKSIEMTDGLEVTDAPNTKRKDAKFFSFKSRVKEFKIKKLNKKTVLGLTEDDKVIVVNENPEQLPRLRSEVRDNDNTKYSDDDHGRANLLQSYEAKKAVLEIYAEKAESGEHLVAKLPKFVYDKESEITRNYEMMSITMNVNR